jgi:hypothetical protein
MPTETADNTNAEVQSQARTARSDWVRWFLILTGAVLALAAYPLIATTPHARYSALAGFALSATMCFPSGWLMFGSLGKDMNRVMAVAFGGMLLRMAIVVGSIFAVAALQFVHVHAYVLALMSAYFVYQALEIVMLKLNFS